MFTIDLLKGEGIPAKRGPESIVIIAITFMLPLIIAIVMFGYYLHTKIVISIQKQSAVNYQVKIGRMSDAVELQKSFDRERSAISNCLTEVSSSIGRYIQWSPILTMLVKNLPDSMVLTALEAKQGSVNVEVPSKDNPEHIDRITVSARALQINVCARPGPDCDRLVRDFRDRLRFSDLLASKLENIRVSQGFEVLDGRDVVSYQIECIFKPGL